jgi:hypothetical protein
MYNSSSALLQSLLISTSIGAAVTQMILFLSARQHQRAGLRPFINVISARDQFFFITLMIFSPSTEHTLTIVCERSCRLAKISVEFVQTKGDFYQLLQIIIESSFELKQKYIIVSSKNRGNFIFFHPGLIDFNYVL